MSTKVFRQVRFYVWFITIILLFCLPVTLFAADFYVSPTGNSSASGSKDSPWDLVTALAQPAAVVPGSTIWLRGGTYVTSRPNGLRSTLNGTASQPIIVRAYPGEKVVWDTYAPNAAFVDSYVLLLGDYVHYWDLEVTNTDPNSRQSAFPRGKNSDVKRGTIRINGDYNKLINLVVHDLNNGLSWYPQAAGGEVYGTIFYNNGYITDDGRGYAHNIYTSNTTGKKTIKDNLVFNSFNLGLQAYHAVANPDVRVDNYDILGNTWFNAGAGMGVGFLPASDVLVGGDVTANNINFHNNYVYKNGRKGRVGLGYYWGVDGNTNLQLNNNRVGGNIYFEAAWTPEPIASGNLISGSVIENKNGNAPASGITTGASLNEVAVRPNDYQPGRGHVTVFNWDKRDHVSVDLSSVLSVGASYEIYHVYSLSTPILTGVFRGTELSIPMRDTQAPLPIAWDKTPITMSKEFGAFLVVTTENGSDTSAPGAPMNVRLE